MPDANSWENTGVMHLVRRTHQMHRAAWREQGIAVSPQQFGVLFALSKIGACDQHTVAQAAALDDASAGELIKRLARDGYISRTRSTTDRRAWTLELTSTGTDALEQAKPLVSEARNQILKPLSTAEVATLRQLLLHISRR